MVKLEDVCIPQYGYPFDSNLFNDSNGYPLIRIRNIKQGATDTKYAGKYDDSYIVDNGDLLVGMDGEFNVSLWQGGKALLNQRVCKLTGFKGVIKDYVFAVIQDPLKKIEAVKYAVTVKHLSSKDINDLEIPLPPLETQREIVAEIEAERALVESNRKLVEIFEKKIQVRLAEIWGENED